MSDQIPDLIAKLLTREQRTLHDEYVMAALDGAATFSSDESDSVKMVMRARAIADEAMRQRECGK